MTLAKAATFVIRLPSTLMYRVILVPLSKYIVLPSMFWLYTRMPFILDGAIGVRTPVKAFYLPNGIRIHSYESGLVIQKVVLNEKDFTAIQRDISLDMGESIDLDFGDIRIYHVIIHTNKGIFSHVVYKNGMEMGMHMYNIKNPTNSIR